VVGALCRGLAYVHTRKRNGQPLGIVHRDVGPQNVLLSREGEVKLSDFGIAKAVNRRERSATGVIKGKFAYMSPEQSVGAELDARSDLFAVGTLLYLLTTGNKPFEGDTDVDVLMQVRKARFTKPSTVVKDFNPDVERFIARALRADRKRRWQSAEQMADKIDAILAKLGQQAGPAVLKRWLETLAGKDGEKTPAEMAEAASNTIELASRDFELEDVSAPAETVPDPPARAASKTAATRKARGATPAPEAGTRPQSPPADLLESEAAYGALTRVARVGRWLRRTVITTIVLTFVLAGGAYFARPYLPARLVRPVEGWLRALPGKLRPGSTPDQAPAPDNARRDDAPNP
jgi:hypothetical protein